MSSELQSIKFPRPQIDPLNAREKRIVKGSVSIVIAMFLVGAMLVEGGPVPQWVHHRDALAERDRIAAVMNPLADAGNADAVIWHAQNYPGASLDPLRKLADAGNAHAQWVLANILLPSNAAEALRLARMAAEGGYPDAVNYEIESAKKAKVEDAQS